MARNAGSYLRVGRIPRSASAGMPGVAEILIVLVIVVVISLVPAALLVWFVRYLIEMSRERRRLRIEVSKLAHEVETLRGDREQVVDGSST